MPESRDIRNRRAFLRADCLGGRDEDPSPSRNLQVSFVRFGVLERPIFGFPSRLLAQVPVVHRPARLSRAKPPTSPCCCPALRTTYCPPFLSASSASRSPIRPAQTINVFNASNNTGGTLRMDCVQVNDGVAE